MIFWLLVLAAVVVFISGCVRLVMGKLMKEDEDDGGAKCGGCGYAAEGLPGLRCPECGADLRKVGICVGRSKKERQIWVGKLMIMISGPVLAVLVVLIMFAMIVKELQVVR